MHIPDGFISPKVYVPLYVVTAGLWFVGLRKLKNNLDESSLPRMAVLSALSFTLMMVTFPLPGGTSVHATATAILALSLGPWMAFMAISMVLLIQSFFLGAGGITALPINVLAMGFLGCFSASLSNHFLGRFKAELGQFVAGGLSVVLPAAAVALVLGAQPLLAVDPSGRPLFFPFGWDITFPAIMIPHLILGLIEGILTVFALKVMTKTLGQNFNG